MPKTLLHIGLMLIVSVFSFGRKDILIETHYFEIRLVPWVNLDYLLNLIVLNQFWLLKTNGSK